MKTGDGNAECDDERDEDLSMLVTVMNNELWSFIKMSYVIMNVRFPHPVQSCYI